MPDVEYDEARQPLEIIRYKIRRMLKARCLHAFDEQQQTRYTSLRTAEKRCLDALEAHSG